MPNSSRIFIIATGPDVRTVREIAKRQIVQEGMQIVELLRVGEHAKTSDQRQEVAIGECDAVFHLVGRTFGPKPAQFDLKQRRRSYGEIEHDIARRLGKPVFTVVCADHYFFDQHEDDAASLQKLHQERRDRILKSGVPHVVVKARKELLARVDEFIQALKLRQFGPGWQTDAGGEGAEWDWHVQPVVTLEEPSAEEALDFAFTAAPTPPLAPAHPAAPIAFALFGPDSLTRGNESALDLWAFVEDQRVFVEASAPNRAQSEHPDADPDAAIAFDLRLTIPSLHIYDEGIALTWSGLPVFASWTLRIPALGQSGGHPGQIEVRALGARVASLQFQLSLSAVSHRAGEHAITTSELPTEIVRPQSAFVCYASAERAYLDAVLRPLFPLWPQLDLFLDIDALREQDDWWDQCRQRVPNSDLFLLVWSSVAEQSEQVQEELALALEGQGRPEIVPFPIENSELAPPPPTLPAEKFEAAFRLVVAAQEWPAADDVPAEESAT